MDATGDGVDPPPVPSHITPSNMRTLWIVVLLNVVYGIAEMAALVLLPHRACDANVRTVRLFSRNDALGTCGRGRGRAGDMDRDRLA